MSFFSACTDAFAGLTRLYLRYLKLAENDIPNIIATCKRLEYLRLSVCQTEDSMLHLQVEHPRLVELDISSAGLELVELNSLPNLKRLVFSEWLFPQEPLSFGNIPMLSSLSLTNASMRWQKVIRLSQFLPSVPSIRDLHLSFLSEKVITLKQSLSAAYFLPHSQLNLRSSIITCIADLGSARVPETFVAGSPESAIF